MKRRVVTLILCICCCSINYGDCQYSASEAYNQVQQRNVDNDPSLNYMKDYVGDYSQQQQTKSYQTEEYEKPMPYNFGFNVDDGYGTKLERQEKGDENGYVKGSYGYMDPDGIYRQVEYTAGPDIGFQAKIKSNEPGLRDNDNPADVEYMVEPAPAGVYAKYQPKPKQQQIAADDGVGYESPKLSSPPITQTIVGSSRYESLPPINQVKEHPQSNYETQDTRLVGKRFTDNQDNNGHNGYGRFKPILSLIKPRQQTLGNANDEYYQYSDSSSVLNFNTARYNDMIGYASSAPIRRRYIYRKVYI